MTDEVIPAQLANACRDVRAAVKADAVGGVVPRYVAAPASTQEAGALLRAAAELGLAVVPRGAGTRLDWGAPPARCDLVVETRQLDKVLEHAAGDLVVRVQAGVRLADLAEVLNAAGQRLALDPPAGTGGGARAGTGDGAGDGGNGAASAAGAGAGDGGNGAGAVPGGTAGGLVATGVAGPLRLRFGLPRDLLIGVTMVRADGVVAKAGGKVVKNVAGYDIGKLLAGSYGTLGLITEATFRLHPQPPAVAYVSVTCPDAASAADVSLSAAASPLAPSAVELDWPRSGAPVSVAVLLEGDPDGVAERADRLHTVLANAGPVTSADPPLWWGRGAAAAGAGTVLRIAFWAGQLADVLTAIREAARRAGLDPAISGSGAAGVLHAAVAADAPAQAVAQFVASLRAEPDRDPAGASVGPRASAIVLHAPAAVRDTVDMWGPAPSGGLMLMIKDQFDPEHRMAPGRFAGGRGI
jgi:glycolate oxidase FAD binding subunit